MKISFKTDKQQDEQKILNELKSYIKDLEILPYVNPNPKEIGFYARTKIVQK